MVLENLQKTLSLYLVHPGDEIFLTLDVFPYHHQMPSKISTQSFGEHWCELGMKTRKEDWKVSTALSSMLRNKKIYSQRIEDVMVLSNSLL